MEYERIKESERYYPKTLKCDVCNDKGKTRQMYLPKEFAVKIKDNGNKKGNIMSQPKLLSFRDYVISGVIQYHKEKQHFRCIKSFGADKTRVWDGNKVQMKYTREEREIVMNEKGWENYIIWYKRLYNLN